MPRRERRDPLRERSPLKARICTECGQRNFGDLDWNCPRHGAAKTEDQPDNPYMGRRIVEADEEAIREGRSFSLRLGIPRKLRWWEDDDEPEMEEKPDEDTG